MCTSGTNILPGTDTVCFVVIVWQTLTRVGLSRNLLYKLCGIEEKHNWCLTSTTASKIEMETTLSNKEEDQWLITAAQLEQTTSM